MAMRGLKIHSNTAGTNEGDISGCGLKRIPRVGAHATGKTEGPLQSKASAFLGAFMKQKWRGKTVGKPVGKLGE
jgi:hypothetical protein